MDNKAFVEALRLRLLSPQGAAQTGLQRAHRCRRRVVDVAEEWFHLLDCASNQRLFRQRHDQVCGLLTRLLSTCLTGPVQREVDLRNADGRVVRADIVAWDGGRCYVIDVAISNPACRTYVRALSDEFADRAAVRREQTKRARYAGVPGLLEGGGFVPFVLEATGRLGPAARNFLDIVVGDHTLARSYFMSATSACITQYNSWMVADVRANVRDAGREGNAEAPQAA